MIANDRLDAALGHWGRADFTTLAGDSGAPARILEHVSQIATTRPQTDSPDNPRRRWWWLGGGTAAALSVAIALLLGGQPQAIPFVDTDPAATLLADADSDDMMLFALFYTPTSEEEYQL